MVEPDSAEPIWKPRAACRGVAACPVSWSSARDAFRAGDVWLARSRRYGDIRKTLLSAPAVVDADRSLPVPASPHDWLAERKFALDEGLHRLDAAARAGAIAGASIDNGMLRIERMEAAVPDGAADLVADLSTRDNARS